MGEYIRNKAFVALPAHVLINSYCVICLIGRYYYEPVSIMVTSPFYYILLGRENTVRTLNSTSAAN